ncbi:MAG TPA: hypothetical protein PKH54_00015 [Myxococcota bacterium]|nr:hypothetical protein [Myxococcota bacterium]HOA12753.1 hypothetical protein [Myxococcota bacterium]HOC98298.1 hypothetical protein [Myxococcota bacterium]HOH77405.1 hypothetical protein [Myxococcota bacterium]HPV04898.1 hypothetical protein [Myxococcota bacterium]
MQILISVSWLALLAAIIAALMVEPAAGVLVGLTKAHPYLMGFAKFVLLGTMGELLGGRIATGRFRLRGIRLWQRALVWGFIGAMLALVFPLFSAGVEDLLAKGLLPGLGFPLLHAFWKSALMNVLFGFEMMVFHRFTDTLIAEGRLFGPWQLVQTYRSIDWTSMFRIVGGALFWFWIPAHTVTFMLPPEYRIAAAALLGIALGLILGFASRKSRQR